MFCRKCHQTIPDESIFCLYCGSKQTKERAHKRSNGSGTIRKVGNKYELRLTVYDPDRRTISRRFDKKSEAQAAAPALRAELIGMADNKRETATVGAIYDLWLSTSATKLSGSKQTAYRIAWNRISKYKNAKIDALDLTDLQGLVAGLTYYPARDIKTLLSHLYKRACAQQDVPTNLAQYIELPPLQEAEPEPFSVAEVKQMWSAWSSGDSFVGYLLLMIYTGMMPGELLKCTQDMINWEDQTITGAGLKTKERKLKPIVLPTIILPVLIQICEVAGDKLVGIRRDAFYDEYHECTKRIGVRDLDPYSCRHTTASVLALNADIAPALITKAMRQTRPLTTERYKHADSDQIREALDQINV